MEIQGLGFSGTTNSEKKQDWEKKEKKKQDNICYSFQADQLMFALHFVRGMHPELFQENVSGSKGEKCLLHSNLDGFMVRLEITSG